jgi:hypothetical protein
MQSDTRPSSELSRQTIALIRTLGFVISGRPVAQPVEQETAEEPAGPSVLQRAALVLFIIVGVVLILWVVTVLFAPPP